MFLYGEMLDSKAKLPDIISKFWSIIERPCVKLKLLSWSEFHFYLYFLFYRSFQNFITFSKNFNIYFLKELWFDFKIRSRRNVWIDVTAFILFSELKNIIWILSNTKLNIFLFFWLKVITSTILYLSTHYDMLLRHVTARYKFTREYYLLNTSERAQI